MAEQHLANQELQLAQQTARKAVGTLPTALSMKNRRGDVVLQLHAAAWTDSNVQRLSLVGRALLVEILMQFALGYKTVKVTTLSAMCNEPEERIRDMLVELVEEKVVIVFGGDISMLPDVSRALLLGADSSRPSTLGC